MALRILGGEAKGFSVTTPPGDCIRPMSVRLKRRIFDAHQDLSRQHFVDLCAGSGAVGLEAWSRGAESVLFYEKNLTVYRKLCENLQRFRASYDCSRRPLSAVRGDCAQWPGPRGEMPTADAEYLLFFAPPYPEHQLYHRVLQTLAQGNFQGELWVESDRQKGLTLEEIERYFTPPKSLPAGHQLCLHL